MFVDRVTIHLSAGKGGNGVIAWRREKYIPKGGPTGGNGGKGGSLILKADSQVFSLDWFRNRRILKAENGGQGGPNRMQGKNGLDLVLKVPCGTLIKDSVTQVVLSDLTEDGQEFVVCKGGKGGKGNDHFKTSTNRAPNIRTLGQPGEESEVELELKLIADVGLVGFPNAGKSTLINTIGKGRAKTAAYPFTTLHPNLGYIQTDSEKRVYIADIPGIIEGASKDRGLGLEFLRHIERTHLLLFLLDASGIDGRDPTSDYKVLQKELKEFAPDLLDHPSIIVLNKVDDDAAAEHINAFKKAFPKKGKEIFLISAIRGDGLDLLREKIISLFK